MAISVRVYLAMPMTGYDRPSMIKLSHELIVLGEEYGIHIISPVIEEKVSGEGPLIQNDEYQLYRFWKRDKQILRNRDGKGAHVVLIVNAHLKSFGCEDEHGFNRYYLWKPTLRLMPDRGFTTAKFESDSIMSDERAAFQYIADHYGTRALRWQWRIKMLIRCFPGFVIDQLCAWR